MVKVNALKQILHVVDDEKFIDAAYTLFEEIDLLQSAYNDFASGKIHLSNAC